MSRMRTADVVATLSEVRAEFSQYLARAENQLVIITRYGKPVAVLISARGCADCWPPSRPYAKAAPPIKSAADH